MSSNFISVSGVVLMFVGILGGVSSVDFFQFWVFLELNLLGFVVYASLRSESSAGGSVMEYFLVQSFYSCLVVMLYLHYPFMAPLSSTFVVLVLMFKLGVAPLHGWLIALFGVLSWETLWFASIPQKLLPVYGISVLWYGVGQWGGSVIWMLVVLSVLVSVSLSLSEVGVGKLLGLSSLFNQGWVISVSKDINLMFIYLVLYAMSLGVFVWWLSCGMFKASTQLSQVGSVASSGMLFFGLCSLAGLPPFGFFFAKVHAARFLMELNVGLSLFLLVSSVFMLLVYTRLFSPGLMSLDKSVRSAGNSRGALMILVLASTSLVFI
uniref:NADH-ubiquinone oxidoreductase chain 2 n=1 Tax=Tigriopus japonicus TaxID=158387 RepID=Q8M6V0_TIGJA|nr:NADH dehydrogenase subunit 2 [Tigriopus japonicus]